MGKLTRSQIIIIIIHSLECMYMMSTKRISNKTWLGRESDLLGIVQEIEFWLPKQVVYVQPGIQPGESDAQTFLRFWETNGLPNLVQTTWPSDSQYHPRKKPQKVNLPNSRRCRPGRQQSKIKRKQKERKISRLFKRTIKRYGRWRWRWYQL